MCFKYFQRLIRVKFQFSFERVLFRIFARASVFGAAGLVVRPKPKGNLKTIMSCVENLI